MRFVLSPANSTCTSLTGTAVTNSSATAVATPTSISVPNSECLKCGTNPRGKFSCCAGAWKGKCGNDDENYEHTWSEGILACQSESAEHKHESLRQSDSTAATTAGLGLAVNFDTKEHVNTGHHYGMYISAFISLLFSYDAVHR